MSLGKVAKICGKFVQDFEVVPRVDHKVFGYQLLEERGRFRTCGGKRSNVLQLIRNTMYLDTNALGQEDVSHITSIHLEHVVGSEDEVVEFFNRNYTTSAKKMITAKEWKKFRRFSRRKVRRWDKQDSVCRQLGIKETSDSDSESDFDHI